MKKSFKKSIAVILSVLMILCSVPFTAFAAAGDYNPNINLFFGTVGNFSKTGLLAGEGAYDTATTTDTSAQASIAQGGIYGAPITYDKKAGTLTLEAAKAKPYIDFYNNPDGWAYSINEMTDDVKLGVGDYFTVTVACDNIEYFNVFSCILKYSDNIEPAGISAYQRQTTRRAYVYESLSEYNTANSLRQTSGHLVTPGEMMPGQCADSLYTDVNDVAGDLTEWDTVERTLFVKANAHYNTHDCTVTEAADPDWTPFFSPVDGSKGYTWPNTLLSETFMFKIVKDGPINFEMADPDTRIHNTFWGGYFIGANKDGLGVDRYTTYAPDTYEIEEGMTADMFCQHGYWQGSCPVTAAQQQNIGSCKMTFLGENEFVKTEPTHVHDYTSEVTKAATCVDDGVLTWTCSNTDGLCDKVTYTEVIPATGIHTEATRDENVVPATCTQAGSKDVVTYCSVCNTVLGTETGVVIPKIDHTSVDVEAKDPTCTEAGYTAGTKCGVCGEVLSGMEKIPETGHDFTGAMTPVTDKTHAVACVNGCGDSETVDCAFTDHDETVKEATPTEEGLVRHYCACGNFTEEVIPMTDCEHNGATHIEGAYDETCTTPGFTGNTICDICGQKIADGQEIPAHAHKFDGRVVETVITEPDYENEGSKEVKTYCSECDTASKTEMVAIPVLTGGVKVTVAATDLGTTTLNGEDATNKLTKTVAPNSTVTITAQAAAGAEFVGWAVNGKLVSDSATFTAPALAEITYVPVFTAVEENEFTVVFTDPYGNVISTQSVASAADLVVPENIVRPGYTFTGWSVDPSTVTEGITIVAQFEKNAVDAYTVTADGCKITADGKEAENVMENVAFDTKVTVTSAGATAWKSGDSIVGYGESYTFFCGSDITLTPVTTTVTITPTVTSLSKELITGSDYRVMFLATRTMTDDCQYVSSGFVYGANVDGADLKLDNVNGTTIRAAYSASSSEQFALTSGIKSKTGTLRAVPFLVYVDASNVQHVDYATPLEYKY